LRELKNANLEITQSPLKPESLGEMVKLINNGTISGKIAKEVFEKMLATGKSPQELVKELGLEQLSDLEELSSIITQVLANNSAQVEQYCRGKEGLYAFFVGQVMKATRGKANPQMVNELLKEMLAAKSQN
jgi:aspartyl-tRNA(Asn)/glutamyl-tRNA(Gln) amidotransferase subunit B